MAKVLEIMIETCFRNHIYKWDNQIRKQRNGGAIGLRATGSLSRVTMDVWIKKFKAKLEELGIDIWLCKKYVDDVLVIVTNLKLGTRLKEGKLEQTEHDLKLDTDEQKTKQEITMNVLRQVACGIFKFLEFTTEVSTSPKDPVACLDTQLWVGKPEGGKPWFKHS